MRTRGHRGRAVAEALLAVVAALAGTAASATAAAPATPPTATAAPPPSAAPAASADARALVLQGYAAYYGAGAPLDLSAAERLFRQAQAAGAPSALCHDWVWGVGFAVDLPFARECFRLAGARDWVAYMIAAGIGGTPDAAAALAYLDRTASGPPPAAVVAPPPAAPQAPPRLLWSPAETTNLDDLRAHIAAGTTGSYYDPEHQRPSPCWFLADNTADSVRCMDEEVGADEERTSIAERRLAQRLGPSSVAVVAAAREAWVAFARADAALEAYLGAGEGSMSAQLGVGAYDGEQVERAKRIEALLAGSWPPPADEAARSAADAAMNDAYRALRRSLVAKDWPRDLRHAADRLLAAQRAWLAHRDADAALAQLARGGDARAATAAKAALTSERIARLGDLQQSAREGAGRQ